jgi:hypothetical protein
MTRPRRFDVLLPALIALAGAVEIIVVGYQPRWPSVGAFLLAAGVVSRARVAPLMVPPLTAAIFALTPLLGGTAVAQHSRGTTATGRSPRPMTWSMTSSSVHAAT